MSFENEFISGLKRDRVHKVYPKENQEVGKMEEKKLDAFVMAIENLMKIFCNNSAIIGKVRI